MSIKRTQLGIAIAVGLGTPVVAADGDHTFSATVTGAGAVAATVAIMASNDLVGWTQIATLAPSGNGAGAGAAAVSAGYAYWRGDVLALTAGASVTVVAATEEATGGSASAGLIALGNTVPVRRVKRFGGIGAGTANFCMAATIPIPFGWADVRPVFYNSLGVALAACTASIAVTANIAGGWSLPTGALQALTVGGSAVLAPPAALSGGGTINTIYSRTVGDWCGLSSTARDDGGPGRLLHLRWFVPSASNANDLRCSGFVPATSTLTSDEAMCGFAAGDQTLTAAAGFARLDVLPPIALEFASESQIKIIQTSGDSIMQGLGYAASSNNTGGCALALRDLRQAGKAYDQFQTANGSMPSPAFLTNALNALNDAVSSVAVMQVGSVNDTDNIWSQSWADRCIRDAILFIQTCRAKNVVPALRSMNPKDGLSAPNEAARQALILRGQALAAVAGAGYINTSGVLTAAGATGGYLAGLSTDGVHCNGAGYAVEKAVWVGFLATV